MSWGEIKKAINSTIGTDEFRSLDEMILGQKKLVASDNVFVQDLTYREFDNNDKTIVELFRVNTSGSVRIKFFGNGYHGTAYLGIYVNGTQRTSIPVEYESGSNDGAEYQTDITVQKGDVIGFNAYNTKKYEALIDWIKICADVVDGSLVEYIG